MALHLHVAGADDVVIKADSTMGRNSTALEVLIPSGLTDKQGVQAVFLPAVDTVDEVDSVFEPDSDSDDANVLSTFKTCTVCDRTMPTSTFPSPAPGTACTHEQDICKDCWQNRIEAQLNDDEIQATNISCAQCENKLHQNDLQALALPALFARYHRACTCLLMAGIADFRWCINGSCTSGQIHDAGTSGNIFNCGACGYRSCVDCNAGWHSGQTCEQFQQEKAAFQRWDYLKEVDSKRRRGSIFDRAAEILAKGEMVEVSATSGRLAKEDAESLVSVERHSKECPGCATRIQKNGGCDHMHCSRCDHEFCFECLADFQPILRTDNRAHRMGCKWRRL